MTRKRMRRAWQLIAILVWILAACNSATRTPPTLPTPNDQTTKPAQATSAPTTREALPGYSDPFAYCAAAGDKDRPDSRYLGEPKPDTIVEALRQVVELPDDIPSLQLKMGMYWRCMDGKVYACFVGGENPCWDKADTSQTPRPEAVEFCKTQSNAQSIPSAIAGYESLYEWRCTDGTPEIVREKYQLDQRGYPLGIWYELGPPNG